MIFGSFIRMNMMNIKTGNYILWVSLLSLLIIILLHQSIIVIEDEEESKARLEIFQSPKGWGYQIIMGQKILIYQPFQLLTLLCLSLMKLVHGR